jgi:hypothetical protein
MTSQSPRIYIYKITFEEVPYYYYGSKKEKYYNQEYWGSPVTHKWMWKFYTPKKQILQLFDTREEANAIENRIIKHFINEPYCLNENCGGIVSLSSCIKGGLKNKENGTGVYTLTKEQRSKGGKIAGQKNKELQRGIFTMSTEELSSAGKIGGKRAKELKSGFHGRTKEQMSEDGKKVSKSTRIRAGKTTGSQRWMCNETGFITTPGALTHYQRAKGIDTSKRVRIS